MQCLEHGGFLIQENSQVQIKGRGRGGDDSKLNETLGILEGSSPVFTKTTVLQVWFGDPWGSSRPFQGALRSKVFPK